MLLHAEVVAPHRNLVDRSVLLAIVPDYFRDLGGIKRRPSTRAAWRRGRNRHVADQVQRRFYMLRQIRRFAHPVHVHVEHVRLIPEKMIVQRRNIDPVIEQRRKHRIYFFLQQHQIAHHHVRAVRGFRQRNPPAESKWRRRRETLNGHLQVVPRNIHFQNARLEIPFPVERFKDLLIISGYVLSQNLANWE